MMWLKACPRCQGDLYAGGDRHGRYIACAQCGHTLNDAQERALSLRPLRRQLHRAGLAAAGR